MPFNRYGFEEYEFAPAFTTNLSHQEVSAKKDQNMTPSIDAVTPCLSNLNNQSSIILDSVGTFVRAQAVESFLPSSVRPLQKAPLRKRSAKKRNVRHRAILTDTLKRPKKELQKKNPAPKPRKRKLDFSSKKKKKWKRNRSFGWFVVNATEIAALVKSGKDAMNAMSGNILSALTVFKLKNAATAERNRPKF